MNTERKNLIKEAVNRVQRMLAVTKGRTTQLSDPTKRERARMSLDRQGDKSFSTGVEYYHKRSLGNMDREARGIRLRPTSSSVKPHEMMNKTKELQQTVDNTGLSFKDRASAFAQQLKIDKNAKRMDNTYEVDKLRAARTRKRLGLGPEPGKV